MIEVVPRSSGVSFTQFPTVSVSQDYLILDFSLGIMAKVFAFVVPVNTTTRLYVPTKHPTDIVS